MHYAEAYNNDKMIFRINGKLFLENVSIKDTSALHNPTMKVEVSEEFLSNFRNEIAKENENFVFPEPSFDTWHDKNDYDFYRHF